MFARSLRLRWRDGKGPVYANAAVEKRGSTARVRNEQRGEGQDNRAGERQVVMTPEVVIKEEDDDSENAHRGQASTTPCLFFNREAAESVRVSMVSQPPQTAVGCRYYNSPACS